MSDGLRQGCRMDGSSKAERSGGDDRCRNGRRSCDSHSGRRKTNRQHIKRCILQPQSEIQKVREYLVEHGFRFEAEDMVEEDGKYYPMMRVVPPEYCEHKTADRQEDCKKEEWEYLYGPLLLKNKNPILYEYLKREIRIREDILLGLAGKDGERIKERMTEIEHELEVAKKAMSYYEE